MLQVELQHMGLGAWSGTQDKTEPDMVLALGGLSDCLGGQPPIQTSTQTQRSAWKLSAKERKQAWILRRGFPAEVK